MEESLDDLSFRQSLLQLLEADPPHEEKLLAEFEVHQKNGQPLHASLLYILTHLTFTETEAKRHWRRILAHRTRLKGCLRRDPGLRVALLDYFVNLNRELKNPKVIEIAIYERTERSAVTDGLTGLYNHAYFLQALRREIQRAKRHGQKLSLAMFDLDDFKKINDTRGHPEGDKVLMKAAALFRETLREIDTAARYGGEEFAAILPETPRTGAFVVADRLREQVASAFRRKKGGPRVTVSGGVAVFPDDASTLEELIKAADASLYRSKAGGKNRITLAKGERRRHARLPASVSVTVNSRAGRRAAKAKNVSEGGLLVSLAQSVPVGSPVNVVIKPNEGAAMDLRGEVVRVEKAEGRKGRYDVGVRLAPEHSKSGSLLALRTGAKGSGKD